MSKRQVIFVLGPPGCGKGTQCRKIAEKFNFYHISAGELLRKEYQSMNTHSKLIQHCFDEGKIVPAEITCKLLEDEMDRSEKDMFLIDGFPRNQDNKLGWDNLFGSKTELLFVLLIDCPVEVCIKRCINRASNVASKRTDDNYEVLKKRIRTHIVETKEIIEYFERINVLKRIDGSKSEDEVFKEIRTIIVDVIK